MSAGPIIDLDLQDRVPELEQKLKFWRRVNYVWAGLMLLDFFALLVAWENDLAVLFLGAFLAGWVVLIVLTTFYYRSFIRYWMGCGLTKAGAREKWHQVYPPNHA